MAYRNASGWDDSGAHVYVRLGQGDTYRHAGVEYAHDGLPIHNSSRDEYPAPRLQREQRAGGTTRLSQPSSRPRAESQPHRRTLREYYEENPPPPRPRYTEEDELREYYASRFAQNLDNNRRNDPPPASQTRRRDPSPGSYQYYLNDNEYHNTAHWDGSTARTRDLFSPLELIQYREYDEQYYAGRHRSPIHGREGHYGDGLRHERYIAAGSRYAALNTPRRQPYSNPLPPQRSNFDAFHPRFELSPLEAAEAESRLYGLSPLEVAEAEGYWADRDPLYGRYDAGDPCPDPRVHIGKHGICFARRDAGYPG